MIYSIFKPEKQRYIFYFDESFHDRVITRSSLLSNKYYDSYTSVGVGIKKTYKNKGLRNLRKFEKKYLHIFDVNELKSTIVKPIRYKNGLASFDKNSTNLYTDFFNVLFENDFIYYISSVDKLEYILRQCNYDKSLFMNHNALIYSIVKALNVYKPDDVIDDIMTGNKKLFNDLINFLERQIKINGNIKLKEKENMTFLQCILFLKNIQIVNVKYKFSYDFTYYGLMLLMEELNIDLANMKVIIDKEGQNEIIKSAKKMGFINSMQLDSNSSIGVRASDLLCGFFSRMMRAIYLSTYNNPSVKYNKKHLLPSEWFNVNKNQFNLYKIISKYLKKYSYVYYSTFISNYSDLFNQMIGVIYYFDEYLSYEKYMEVDENEHCKKCNSILLMRIDNHIKQIELM